jgi:hypothetical protein
MSRSISVTDDERVVLTKILDETLRTWGDTFELLSLRRKIAFSRFEIAELSDRVLALPGWKEGAYHRGRDQRPNPTIETRRAFDGNRHP